LNLSPQEISDEKILNLLRDQNQAEQGFRLLMTKYQERLYWHIRRMVGEHDDANDVMQNCMIKVFRNIGGFQGKSQLYTWLYRIATNEAITFLKKKKRKVTTSMDDEELNIANRLPADSEVDGELAQRALREALVLLPEKQRMVFQLRYFEEMSYRDMSEALGTSEGALKASYHHAVKKVEQYIRNVNAF
jgi:RNA polymerase sigma factor (sigma-70 family)